MQIHMIISTGPKPYTYRTICGMTVRREQGTYVYTLAERQTRITCQACKGK